MDGTIEEIKRRNNNMTQENFEQALAKEGLNLDTFRKQLEKQLLRTRLINLSLKIEPKVGEKELKDFYQKNVDRYRGVETYRPGHILFYVPKETAPEEVQEIRRNAKGIGED
jgi:peptidyl-prolyl cis-trans isomerase SurA